MRNKPEGFTLIELMVAVAIIGILIAVVAPNVLQKIQTGKQVGTMEDMRTIAAACLEYITENDEPPGGGAQNGQLTPDCAFVKALTEKLLTKCPIKDKWGNPYVVYTGQGVAQFPGFSESMAGKTDFIIVSYGRKGVDEGFVFDPEQREAGIFESRKMADYDKNLVNWNGSWIRAPKS
jgi:prepilin-type N-terminal cleavage/methylation domain-containing protein